MAGMDFNDKIGNSKWVVVSRRSELAFSLSLQNIRHQHLECCDDEVLHLQRSAALDVLPCLLKKVLDGVCKKRMKKSH
jgi:hypothetical protein